MARKETLPSKNGGHSMATWQHPFETLHADMDRLIDRYFNAAPAQWFSDDREFANFAKMDVSENDKAFDITVDVPGLDEKDIDVSLSGNLLLISGKRESSSEEKKDNFHRIERSFGSFQRRVELPAEVDTDKIEASVKKGVLALHLPKSAKAKSKERKIAINAS
ncbi:Hsp20/alpha crystallin family protein [Kordiimonas marina]|uniref:Hsp20/alpha crystallin family protein n=1 Tax=Kordiimonas marina TaxID=2872312 RepID=UPI001FF2FE94|nr:Hsp20/alpha crystallin family protein [Kordiimonas marina]MCJ9428815.1 Hsp20/alpha crystallin family protein [Kordiimonas marina]